MQEIKITRAEQRKEKPDSSKLVFGKYMTAHGGATAPIEDHTDET